MRSTTADSLARAMKSRDETTVDTSAAAQAPSMPSAPAEKLSMAGTRPKACIAMNVTTAPLAFGSMRPTRPPSGASGASRRPSTAAPTSIWA